MLGRIVLVTLLASVLAMAGCINGGTDDELDASDESVAPAAEPTALPPFELVGTDCVEGGGHSVHPRSIAGEVPFHIPPVPWERADVLEDTGPQLVYSEIADPAHPVPTEGETWGNFHATVWCGTWTFNGESRPDLVFGYVGAKVEEPPFGDGVPSRNYIVTVVATNDADVLAALHAAGIHATQATATMSADGTALHTVLATEHHGTYESRFLLKELGEMPAEPFRLWFQHENQDGTYSPVSLDLAHTVPGRHYGAEGQGLFSHTGTDMHGPQGGAWGHTAAVAWMGHDRVITLGPRPGVAIADAYHH